MLSGEGMIIVDLKPHWEYAQEVVRKRFAQKKNYRSRLPLNPNYELIGFLGEIVFSEVYGEKVNDKLLAYGDDGYDFSSGVDVKTTEEKKILKISTPYLIEMWDKPIPIYYFQAIVNLEKQYGYLYGWTTGKYFSSIFEVVDFGYGKRKCLPFNKLFSWGYET